MFADHEIAAITLERVAERTSGVLQDEQHINYVNNHPIVLNARSQLLSREVQRQLLRRLKDFKALLRVVEGKEKLWQKQNFQNNRMKIPQDCQLLKVHYHVLKNCMDLKVHTVSYLHDLETFFKHTDLSQKGYYQQLQEVMLCKSIVLV